MVGMVYVLERERGGKDFGFAECSAICFGGVSALFVKRINEHSCYLYTQ